MKKTRKKTNKHLGLLVKALLCFVLVAAMVLPANLPVVAAGKTNLSMDVVVAYGNTARYTSDVPFEVTITNKGTNFEGRLQIITSTNNGNIMREKDFSIASNGTKVINLSSPVSQSGLVNVRIVTADEKNVINKEVAVNFSQTPDLRIGVLTDDISALSYLNGITFFTMSGSTNVLSKLLEFNADTFPEDLSSLSSLDFILISDFSTDQLSPTQLSALNKWVFQGGHLIVCTGQTYTKSLSGLKDLSCMANFDLSKITIDSYTSSFDMDVLSDNIPNINTDNYSFLSRIPNSIYKEIMNEIDKALASVTDLYEYDYYACFDTFFNNLSEDIVRYQLGELFFDDYFLHDDEEWNNYTKELVYSYLSDNFRPIFQSRLDDILEAPEPIPSSGDASITLDIASFASSDTDTIMATDKNQNVTFPFATNAKYGKGSVLILGFDLTKEPLCKYTYRSKLFSTTIVSLYSLELENKLYDLYNYSAGYSGVSNGAYSYYSNMGEHLNSAGLPPVLIFAIVLVLYLISIFVLFKKLKKRRKNIYFWGAQAVLALVFTLIVYLCGITSRLSRPEIRNLNIRKIVDGGEEVTDVMSFVMPKSKHYQLSTDSDKMLYSISEKLVNYYSHGGNRTSLGDYHIGVNVKPDEDLFSINNSNPLSSEIFAGNHYGEKKGSISIMEGSPANATKYTLTNEYCCDFEYAYLLSGKYIYFIGDFKKGQVVSLSNNNAYFSIYNAAQYDSMITDSSIDFSILLLGSQSNDQTYSLIRNLSRSTILGLEQIDLYSSNPNELIFVGFTKEALDTPLQSGTNYKEQTYTMVYQVYRTN